MWRLISFKRPTLLTGEGEEAYVRIKDLVFEVEALTFSLNAVKLHNLRDSLSGASIWACNGSCFKLGGDVTALHCTGLMARARLCAQGGKGLAGFRNAKREASR